MIKTIVFDFGGVIITLDQQQAIQRFEQLGLTNAAEMLDPYTQHGLFGDLEIGKISGEEFRQELCKLVGREVSYDECRHAWLGYHKELPKRNLQFLRKLRAEGYRVIMLSNTNEFMQSWAESTEFDGEGHGIRDYFDAIYRSYEVKMMKPADMFFRHVLTQEKIFPSETLFVDDGPRNVAVASQIGFRTFCPENGSDWTHDVYALLNAK